MIDEPVEKESDRRTKENCGVDQMTISSASRERCVAQIEAIERNSSAKSRSETLSMELRVGSRKPSALAVMDLSIGKPVPASAAAPSGLSSSRSTASRTRDRSRANIST